MVLANPEFTRHLRNLAAQTDFARILRITDDQRLNQKALEYAVRLVVHTFEDFPRGRDVQEYLDEAILRIMGDKDPTEAIAPVAWSISTLYRLFGDDALIPPDDRQVGIAQRFSLRALEGIGAGLARNKARILGLKKPDEFIKKKIGKFWQQAEVADMSASGLRGSVRLQRTVAFGAKWFDPNA
jgi:hypothetical protein